MKRLITCLATLLFLSCQGSSYQWFDGTFEEARAVAGSKLIFLKFYTKTKELYQINCELMNLYLIYLRTSYNLGDTIQMIKSYISDNSLVVNIPYN